eukprot:1157392-Pelagomonas_calceolata.AAC.2
MPGRTYKLRSVSVATTCTCLVQRAQWMLSPLLCIARIVAGVLSDSGKLDAAIVAFGEALRRDPVLIEVRAVF